MDGKRKKAGDGPHCNASKMNTPQTAIFVAMRRDKFGLRPAPARFWFFDFRILRVKFTRGEMGGVSSLGPLTSFCVLVVLFAAASRYSSPSVLFVRYCRCVVSCRAHQGKVRWAESIFNSASRYRYTQLRYAIIHY